MERRIVPIGGYSFYVSLPKSWVESLKNSIVEMKVEDGNLILSPKRDDEKENGNNQNKTAKA